MNWVDDETLTFIMFAVTQYWYFLLHSEKSSWEVICLGILFPTEDLIVLRSSVSSKSPFCFQRS